MSRDFSKVRRVVVKVGTATLAKGAGIDRDYVAALAEQLDGVQRRAAVGLQNSFSVVFVFCSLFIFN